MSRFLDDLARIYEHNIIDAGKQPQLLMLMSFLITFSLVRVLVHRIRSGHSRIHNLERGGLHVHHLVWGILLLLVTGFFSIAFEPGWPWRPALAICFGIGAALTLDEFALWLNLRDVYWAKQGRESVDAVIVATSLASVLLISNAFWWDFLRLVARVIDFELGAESFDSESGPLLIFYAIGGMMTLLGIWRVLAKAGHRGWLALVPFVNIVMLLRVAGRRSWWIMLYVIPIAGILASIVVGEDLAERFGRSRRFGIGLGLLPPVFLLILGFSRDQYHAKTPVVAPATS
jgi:hypothetical protein